MRNYLLVPLLGAAMIAYACTPDGNTDGGGNNNDDGGPATVDAGVDGGTASTDGSSSGGVHSSDSSPSTDSSSRRDGSSSGEVHSSDSNASATDSSRNDSSGTATDSSRVDTSSSRTDSSTDTSDSRGSSDSSVSTVDSSSRADSSSGAADGGVSTTNGSSRTDTSSGTPDAGTGAGMAKVTLMKNAANHYDVSSPRVPSNDGPRAYAGQDTVSVNGSTFGLTTIDWSDVPGCYDVRRVPPAATLTWPAPAVTPVRKYLKTIFVVEDPAAQAVTCGSSYTVKTTVQIGTSFTYDREPPVDMDGCWMDNTVGVPYRLTMRHMTDYATPPSYYNSLYGEWILGGLSEGGYQADGFDFVVRNGDGSVRRSGSVSLDGETLTIGPPGFQSVLVRWRDPVTKEIKNTCI